MNDLIDSINSVVPPKYQTFFLMVGVAIKYGSEFYSSVRAGGGLKRIIMSFWFGEQVSSVIAKDYKEELNTKNPTASHE